MARTDGHGEARRRTRTTRRSPSPAPPLTSDAVLETEPLRATVDTAFRNREIIADAVRTHLKARTVEAASIRKRAETALADFTPSSYSKDERARLTYLAPNDDLPTVLEELAKRGAKALARTDRSSGIRLERGDALEKLIKKGGDDDASTIGTIKISELVEYVSQQLAAGTSSALSLRVCDAEADAERRLTAIESGAAGSTDPDGLPSTNGGSTEDGHRSARELVKSTVNGLMGTVVPPEARFPLDPPKRADDKAIATSIDTFELRDGPSDVTSYHDFNNLQIAFQHVWTEVFDGELERLGKELYEEYVRLNEFAGLDNGKDREISTVADLSRLIGDIQGLSRLTQAELPGGSTKPGGSTRDVPAGAQDQLGGLVESVLTGDFIENDVLRWVLNPAGAAVGFLSDLFAGKQQAGWESFEPGRTLPGGIDIITATFEEGAVAAGTVEIVVTNSAAAPTWKGIDFYEIDATGRPLNLFKIANDPRDRGVWNAQSYNRLPLYTQQVTNGVLEFGKEIMFGAHKGHYFLIGLDEKLKDRTRVTFNWTKDK